MARLEQTLGRLSTSPSPRPAAGDAARESSHTTTLRPLPAARKTWTDSTSFVERDPSFECQSYFASQIAELASKSNSDSPEVADQLKTLSSVSSIPVTSTPRFNDESSASSVDHALKREQAPAAFVLKIIRRLEGMVSRAHVMPDPNV